MAETSQEFSRMPRPLGGAFHYLEQFRYSLAASAFALSLRLQVDLLCLP